MALPTLTIGLQTHERVASVREVLDAALADDPDEVVVVINACDRSHAALKPLAQRDRRLRLVVADHRLKLGPARAAAVEAATCDVVLLIDDDVVLRPGAVAGHKHHHAEGGRLVVQGYMPVAAEARRRSLPARLYAEWYEQQVPRWEADGEAVLRGLWGGHISIRRAHALEVSPANPAFSADANQDRDWGLRLLKAAFTGRFDRSLLAEHRYVRTVAQFVRYQRSTGRGTWLVHELHHDILGRLPDDYYLAHLAGRQRWIVSRAGGPGGEQVVGALTTVARAAHALPLPERAKRAPLLLALTAAQQRAARASMRAALPTA